MWWMEFLIGEWEIINKIGVTLVGHNRLFMFILVYTGLSIWCYYLYELNEMN